LREQREILELRAKGQTLQPIAEIARVVKVTRPTVYAVPKRAS
jgi:transcriptional regulator